MNDTEKADPLTVNRQSFRRYLAELRDRNIATTSVSRKVSTIKGFFRFLQREGKLPANPLALVSPPKRARLLPTILRKDDLVALIEAADETTPGGLRNRAILELMYAAGVRLSEVVGLDLESLALSEHTVRVRGKGNKERIVLIRQPAARAGGYLSEGRPTWRTSRAGTVPEHDGSASPDARSKIVPTPQAGLGRHVPACHSFAACWTAARAARRQAPRRSTLSPRESTARHGGARRETVSRPAAS
jgi:integrase